MVPETLALGLGLWLFNAVVLAPGLAAAAMQRLLERGPRGQFGTYLLRMGAFTLAQLLALFAILLALGGSVSTAESGPWAFLALLVPVLGALVLAFVLLGVVFPWLGHWEPRGEGFDGRLVLVGLALWYVVAAGGATITLALVAFVLGFPG